ncbi:hypothetical protein D6D22_00085 [Aureobasidium pullulans]|nr:hypothetical protein D6D22_00085 [Aureobasidium pullulans]
MIAPDQDTYDQHWQDTVGDLRHLRCQICKVVFRTGHALEQHSKVHRPANITCIFCPNNYCSYSDMIRHIEANGCQNASIESIQARIASIRPYGFCMNNESLDFFYDYGDFKPHDKPYECAQCDRFFKDLGSLTSHLENSASCEVGVHGRFFETILAALRDEHYWVLWP